MAAVVDEAKSTGRAIAEFDGLDADRVGTHADTIACAFDRLERVDLVILCVGVLGGQSGLDADPNEVTRVLCTNFLGLRVAALARSAGTASAGPRHRRGALECRSRTCTRVKRATHGDGKAGLDALAQVLADEVTGTSVRVLVVSNWLRHHPDDSRTQTRTAQHKSASGRRRDDRGAGWPQADCLGTRRAALRVCRAKAFTRSRLPETSAVKPVPLTPAVTEIVMIEDEPGIGDFVKRGLEARGFTGELRP